MVFDSIQLLQNAIFYEEKLISSLRAKVEDVETDGAYLGSTQDQIVETLKKLEADSFHHEEILNYWREQLDAGAKI